MLAQRHRVPSHIRQDRQSHPCALATAIGASEATGFALVTTGGLTGLGTYRGSQVTGMENGRSWRQLSTLTTCPGPLSSVWAVGGVGEQAPHTQVSDSGQWRARPCHRPVRHSDFTRWNSLEDSGSVSQNKTKKISIYTKHPLVTQKARITSKMPGIVLQ